MLVVSSLRGDEAVSRLRESGGSLQTSGAPSQSERAAGGVQRLDRTPGGGVAHRVAGGRGELWGTGCCRRD